MPCAVAILPAGLSESDSVRSISARGAVLVLPGVCSGRFLPVVDFRDDSDAFARERSAAFFLNAVATAGCWALSSLSEGGGRFRLAPSDELTVLLSLE